MSAKQNRPGGRSQAARNAFAGAFSLHQLDALATLVNGAFVVMTERVSDDGTRWIRRPYLTAAAAETAARNAQKRGQSVRVYLAELKPLHRIEGTL